MPYRLLRVALVGVCLAAARSAAGPPATDADGNPLPEGAVARLGSSRFHASAWLGHLAFAADGKTLTAVGPEAAVCAWDAEMGRELRRLPHPSPSSFVCGVLSPDGRTVAVGASAPHVDLVDAATGRAVGRLTAGGHRPYCLAWSPDGQRLAAGVDKAVVVWDVTTRAVVRTSDTYPQSVADVAFSPDGKTLATALLYQVRLCDAATGGNERTLDGWLDRGRLTFAPDGKTLAGPACRRLDPSSVGCSLRVWDAATGKMVRDLDQGMFSTPAYSPDGTVLVAAGRGCLRRWDAATGRELAKWPCGGSPTSLAFRPDGKRVAAVVGGRLRVWDGDGSERVAAAGHVGRVTAVAFAPDGSAVASGGQDETVRVWDWATGRQAHRFDGVGDGSFSDSGVNGVAYTPDGRTVVSAEGHTGEAVFRRWDARTGEGKGRFAGGIHAKSLAFTPDGTMVTFNGDGKFALWDAAAGRIRRQVGWLGGRGFTLSPDGRRAAWADQHGPFGVTDLDTGAERWRHAKDGAKATLVAYAPDGTSVAVDRGNAVRFWNAETGRPLPGPELNVAEPPAALAFSTDGRLLAAADGRAAVVWDVAARQEVRRFVGHRGDVKALVFDPRGRALVTASDDGTLLVWDLTGRLDGGKLRPATLTEDELEAAWKALSGRDAAAAQRAVGLLAAAGRPAVAWIDGRQTLAVAPAADAVARLVAKLDADDFDVRQSATDDLAAAGDAVAPALRVALAGKPSEEFRFRAEGLLKAVDAKALSGDAARAVRAVAVLELVGDADARRVLDRLAGGANAARLTVAARGARERLGRQAGMSR